MQVSQSTYSIYLQQEMQPCRTLAAFPKGLLASKAKCVHEEAGSQTALFFSFSPAVTVVFSLYVSSYHKHPRPCVYLLSSLLFPSSSRTRNLHRPARLNLSFSSGGTGIGRRGGGALVLFFSSIEIPFPPYPAQA